MNTHENQKDTAMTFGMFDAQIKAQTAATPQQDSFTAPAASSDTPLTYPIFEAVGEQKGHDRSLTASSPMVTATDDHVDIPSDSEPIDLSGGISTSITPSTTASKFEPQESIGEVLTNASENIGVKSGKTDMVQEFVNFASTLEYAKDTLGNLYVTIKEKAFTDIVPVKSVSFLGFIRDRLYETKAAFLSEKDFKAGLEQVIYQAQKKTLQEKETINRVRSDGQHIYLDMRTTPPSFLKYNLNSGEQDTVQMSPFLPQRFPKQKSLPLPARRENGKAFDEFFSMLNVSEIHDQALIKSFLVSRMAYGELITPCLMFLGDKGSGKTTLSRLIKNIVDPTNAPSHIPAKISDLQILLVRQFLPVIDNISNISAEFSDQLCTAVTGIECGKRVLYTDADEHTLYLKTSAIMTSIKVPHFKDDLASRIFFIRRPAITGGYISESLISEKFQELHPYLLDELLQTCRGVSKHDYRQHLIDSERNVDFTGIMSLVCQHDYGDMNLAQKIVERNNHYRGIGALAGNPVVAAIILFMADKQNWKGTLTELIAAIKDKGFATPDFPDAANAFSRSMAKGLTTLDSNGIVFRKQPNGPNGTPYLLVNKNYTEDSLA